MSFASSVNEIKPALMAAARTAIDTSITLSWANSHQRSKKPPEEPDIVAHLVHEGTKILQTGWEQLLTPGGIQISILGVYCHQTPKVKFNPMNKTCCELGDLLLYHVHTDSGGRVSRNSLLLQAKMASHHRHQIQKGEEDQLSLYSYWPEFEYVSHPLKPQTREVLPNMAHRGAQYLLLDKRPPWDYPPPIRWTEACPLQLPFLFYPRLTTASVCMPDSLLQAHTSFERELVDFLVGRSGRGITNRSHAKRDGWSQVVWDLIQVGLGKTFNRKHSGFETASRFSGPLKDLDGAFWMKDDLSPEDMVKTILGPDNDKPLPDNKDFSDAHTAPSIVVVQTSDARSE